MTRTPQGAMPLSFGRYLVLTATCLVLVFTVMEPQGSSGLGLGGRLVFWAVHVGIGLLLLEAVTRMLSRFGGGLARALMVLVVAGLVGSVLLAPLALATEWVVDQPEPGVPEEGLESVLEGAGIPGRVLSEALAITPGATLTWVLINVPWLLRMDFSGGRGAGRSRALTRTDEPDPPAESKTQAQEANTSSFFDLLPEALGEDLVAISSELHYLRVHTSRGESLVLYTLREALEEAGSIEGERIHRSHWVARSHVVRLRREGRKMSCLLSNELVLPVSRTYQGRMLEVFGDKARYRERAGGQGSAG